MESYKQEKIIIIMYEYLNDKREFYPISNVPLDKAKFFYKDDDGLFKLMAVSDYTVKTELNENRLYIVNAAIKDNSEKFQIGYEINFKAAEYESPLPVLSVLTKMYNQLIEDTRILHSYIRKQCFVADGKEQALVLPNLPSYTVWCMGENGKMFALPVSELYERFGNLIKTMEKVLDEYIEQKKEEIRGPAGAIDNVTASVNSNAGTPKVTVSLSGTPERRKIDLKFENLKGDKPIKGTDYYTEQEKEQFTTETLSLVTAEGTKQVKAVTDKGSEQTSLVIAEGNKQISLTQTEALKVIEQLKSLIAGSPSTSNAQALSGKTRVEFEKDTQALAGKYNGNFPLTSAVKDAVYLVPTTGKFYICNGSYNGKSLSEPNENFKELSVFKIHEKLNNIFPKNINLIPKSSFIWQYGNQLTKNLLHYQYKYNRMCLKPEFWIKVEKGEEYIFEYSDTIYKYAIQIHDGVSSLKDSGWITSGEKYKFISTGEYINIVCARNNNVAFNLEEFYSKIYNLKLYKSDAVEEIIDVNTINFDAKTFVLDKEKTKKGGVETIENNSITSNTMYNRAHYSEIIDVSNIDVIYFDTNLYKNYDIAICTFNEDNQKKDYAWKNPDKILILPYTKYLTISFREKNNSYINYDCLLYNNYLALGFGETPKINIEKKTKSEFPAKYLHIAHRGYQTAETENSIPAFIGACTIGFDAIETDIHLSKDGILYCIHDDTVDRTTNGTGKIADMLSTDIDKLIINSESSYTNEEMHVPKLSEFLAICKKYNKIPVIEIKPINIDYVFVDALINDINRFGLEKKCIVISFSKDALSLLRKKNQNIHIQPLFSLDQANILFAAAYGNAGINSDINNITADLTREAHEYGLTVGVNVVIDKATSDKFLEYGLDMVTSNEYYGI